MANQISEGSVLPLTEDIICDKYMSMTITTKLFLIKTKLMKAITDSFLLVERNFD